MNTQVHQVMLGNVDQTNEPPKQFTFDAVYPEDSITETIYADSVFPLVESVCVKCNPQQSTAHEFAFLSGAGRIQCHSVCLWTNRVWMTNTGLFQPIASIDLADAENPTPCKE